MKKIKIAYIIEKFPSPTEYFILNEILQLEKSGLEIILLVLKKQKQYEHLPEPKKLKSTIIYLPKLYYFLPLPILRFLFSIFIQRNSSIGRLRFPNCCLPSPVSRFLAFIKSIRYYSISHYFIHRGIQCHHIHAHFAFIGVDIAYYLSRLLNKTFSLTCHAQDIYTNENKIRQYLPKAEFLLTCTEFNKNHINKLTGNAFKDKVHLVYHGINIEKWPQKEIRINNHREVQILTIARLVEKKGLLFLLQAINRLIDEGIVVHCTIIGEGGLRATLKEYIDDKSLHNYVRILPFIPQYKTMESYKQADVFILPCIIADNGDRDGLPNVIVEAMMTGVPVISTTVSAIPEVLKHKKTGMLVKEKDDVAIANTIKLLMNDHKLRINIIENARKEVIEKFNIESCTKELIQIFNNHILQS